MSNPPLNQEQAFALDLVKRGKNVFITGVAGTGKSFTVARIVEWAEKIGKKIDVTASTGLAAFLLSGPCKKYCSTFHSWAGIGLGKGNADKLARNMLSKVDVCAHLREVDIVVIDEISMMNAEYMAKVDVVMKAVRKNQRAPFGGIQIIFCGDFGQLPPVRRDGSAPIYLFEHPIWKDTVDHCILLKKVYRQEQEEFVDILTRMRDGETTEEDLKLLRETGPVEEINGVRPTVLYSRNRDVDYMNHLELSRLPGESKVYNANDIFKHPKANQEFVKKKFSLPETLELKPGAQVMLLTNYMPGAGLVNGSRGVVTELGKVRDFVRVMFANGQDVIVEKHTQEYRDENNALLASRQQFPLRLAWSITIHKSQGSSIDRLIANMDGTFETGQAYVALSRARTLDGLQVKGLERRHIKTSQKVKDFMTGVKNEHDQMMQMFAFSKGGEPDAKRQKKE
nr:DEAD-box helicase domain of Pif1 [Sicyoidochytrium minutum DNA virus]